MTNQRTRRARIYTGASVEAGRCLPRAGGAALRTYEKGGFGAGVAAAALLTVIVTAAIPGTAYSSAPEIKLVAPSRAAVGEPIRLSVRAIGVEDIGGYEARLSFDTKAAHVVSVNHRGNSLDSLGRDVRELGPIELADGVEFGAYSCARPDCVAGAATSARKGSGQGAARPGGAAGRQAGPAPTSSQWCTPRLGDGVLPRGRRAGSGS